MLADLSALPQLGGNISPCVCVCVNCDMWSAVEALVNCGQSTVNYGQQSSFLGEL